MYMPNFVNFKDQILKTSGLKSHIIELLGGTHISNPSQLKYKQNNQKGDKILLF